MGHFEAGEAINTVPSHGYLEGTIRTYDTEDVAIVKHQMIHRNRSYKGANLEIVEKNYPSCSVKILVFMVNNLPLHILYLLVLKTMKRFCDWSSYCPS